MQPLRIVTSQRLLPDLQAVLSTPAQVDAFPDDASDEAVHALASEADAFVGSEFRPAWGVPSRLRLVQSVGAGTEGIARSALPPGCVVCNVYGHERAVAEHAFLLMLALQKQLFSLDRGLRAGNWRWEQRMTPELRGRRLLILGLGRIGGELVAWARFFAMPVDVVTRTPSPGRAAQAGLPELHGFSDLPRLLPHADFVVVALPGTPEAQDLLNAGSFERMKPSAYLINVGRAPVVNEAALFDALQTRRIAGAGLDVWYQYPKPSEDRHPSQLPFHTLDNVIMTPHNGGLTAETMQDRWNTIADNLHRFASDQPLLNVVRET